MNTIMMNILGRLKGYNRVRVMPHEKERFFNSLFGENIGIWDVCETDGRIFFSVRAEDMPALYSVAGKFHTSVVIERNHGAVSLFLLMKKYRYVSCVFIFGIICLYMLSVRIWDVNVCGAVLTDAGLIEELLYENGYRSSIKKSSIDKNSLEILIKTNFPYVTSVISDTEGVILNVTVYESEAPIASYDRDIAVDIVAVKDCIIDEIMVFNGTAKVSAGESVKKGDVLISGRVEYTYKDKKETENIHAIGKTLSYEKVFYDNIYMDMYVPADDAPYISEKAVRFMGKTFVFKEDCGDLSGYIKKEEKNMQISLGWLNLPILYDETRWYNTSECRKKSDREIHDEVSGVLYEILPEGYTVVNMSYILNPYGENMLSACVEAVCAVNVGIEKEITD